MEPILAALLACSVHLDDALLLGVAEAFSERNPLTITNVAVDRLDPRDDRLLAERMPRSSAAATELVAELVARGGSPVVGLLPVRPEWAAELAKPSDAVFDVCANIEIASAKLSAFDYACRALGSAPSAAARRQCTLARFGASLGLPALPRAVLLDLPRVAAALAADDEPPSGALALPQGGLSFALAPSPAPRPPRSLGATPEGPTLQIAPTPPVRERDGE
jgi:hypothetical protein